MIAVVYLITTYMYIRRRKQAHDFIQYVTDKPVSSFPARVESEMLPTAFTASRIFRISAAYSSGMAGHVKFRNYHNLSFSGISYYFFYIFLGIECGRCFRVMIITDGTYLSQFGIFFYFDSPSRFIGQMPVEYIQTERSHDVQILLHFFFAEEVTAFIQHETTPLITGGIIDSATLYLSISETRQL